MGYDIIGDVHGQADKLETLLQGMGYRKKAGSFQHPHRTAIFVGDYIDRGPRQVDTYRIVRAMVESGDALAILGNHEFNAIAWHMPDPDVVESEMFLRPRHGELGAKNRQQHRHFLAEVEDSPLHDEAIEWFLTLPLWLDLPELRVVHACWHDGYMAELAPLLGPSRTLTHDLMVRASRRDDPVFRAVEGITKGLEVPLPEGHAFFDKDGHERCNVRIRWWDESVHSYRDLALMPEDARMALPEMAVPANERPVYDQRKPVFIGHYWLQGEPVLQAEKIACVDYSAGKGGPLVAYRWDGENTLDVSHFYVQER
ncbi:metallophosphoesterase [Hydrogenophaga aromaticivorans]|uniref:metallophosphoesterase n=1 Tax=Hydrogenophaga aromaticivorans TaxID=2610898 RepID=UPI001B383E8A|nr:metallophosphoesterase [Hydrogenophaga aromaticivorans]MBQ0917751.1 metallophosphoesterase [Hydrogenophaga aromaticivorans]